MQIHCKLPGAALSYAKTSQTRAMQIHCKLPGAALSYAKTSQTRAMQIHCKLPGAALSYAKTSQTRAMQSHCKLPGAALSYAKPSQTGSMQIHCKLPGAALSYAKVAQKNRTGKYAATLLRGPRRVAQKLNTSSLAIDSLRLAATGHALAAPIITLRSASERFEPSTSNTTFIAVTRWVAGSVS